MADDQELYDEFGNYIGPELDESDDDNDLQGDGDLEINDEGFGDMNNDNQMVNRDDRMDTSNYDNRVILHEDKKYFPNADELYGDQVKTITLEEDAQKLSEPIIKPIKVKNFSSIVSSKENNILSKLKYSMNFMATLMNTPALIRNIAIIGHLHHGKTLFVDTLVNSTIDDSNQSNVEYVHKFTDTRIDEQSKQLSIKSTFVSLILENLKSKSYLINILDCPGKRMLAFILISHSKYQANAFRNDCVLALTSLIVVLSTFTAG